MNINELSLKGFTGIKRGLGLESVRIDLKNLPGLISLEGANGTGKTTILENLHPFNSLASREGALYQHVFDRKAEKELYFEYGGAEYRTLLKIDGESGKSEGYIWKNGSSEVNGKIRDYQKYMEGVLGTPFLFFSSVFCAQNSRKMSDMTAGQLKTLFAEFLRLDRLSAWEVTAKACGNFFSGELMRLSQKEAALSEVPGRSEALKVEIRDMLKTLSSLLIKEAEIRKEISEARDYSRTVAAEVSKSREKKVRLDELREQEKKLTIEMDGIKKGYFSEKEKLRSEFERTEKDRLQVEDILKNRDKISKAGDDLRRLENHLAKSERSIERMAAEVSGLKDEIHQKEVEYSIISLDFKKLENDKDLQEIWDNIHRLKMIISQGEEKTKDLGLKDSSCQSKTCRFIAGALEAERWLPTFRAELDEMNEREGKRVAEIGKRRQEIAEKVEDLGAKIKEKKEFLLEMSGALEVDKKNRSDFMRRREDLKKLSDMAAEIMAAELREKYLLKVLGDLTEKIEKNNFEYLDKKKEIEKRQVEVFGSISYLEKSINLEAEAELKKIDIEIDLLEKEDLPEIEKSILDLRDKVARMNGEKERLAFLEEELKGVISKKKLIAFDLGQWRYLQNACGKNGLQALEIDGAAPMITGYANDLLSQTFGPLFSVRLKTQDDEGREVLDIVVIGEYGEEINLENLSAFLYKLKLVLRSLAYPVMDHKEKIRILHYFLASALKSSS